MFYTLAAAIFRSTYSVFLGIENYCFDLSSEIDADQNIEIFARFASQSVSLRDT